MSDYFGSLMKSSGLASPSETSLRSEPPSAAATDAHADIVELDATHEANGQVSRPQLGNAPLPAGHVLSEPGQSGRPLASNTLASAGTGAAIGIVSDTIVNSWSKASPDASRNNMIRSALEWVAADPHNIGVTPRLEAHESTAQRPSAFGARMDSEHIEIDTAHMPGSQTDKMPAQIVRSTPPPTPPASRVWTGFIPEEVNEISIGAIHVRVDAPAPSTTAHIAPHEGAQSRPSPARPTTHSALSRRALRRI